MLSVLNFAYDQAIIACYQNVSDDDTLTFWRRNYFLNFGTPVYKNVNNTGTKYVRIMKQNAF